MIFIQTWTLAVDAYREINSKKLFWITLALSLIVVGVFAFVGINETGITVFGRTFPAFINTTVIPPSAFYMFIFANLAIPFWLTWAATILALVSVCGMFPDFLAGGSIDLYLSRPLGRLRLFVTKYVMGLLFVAAQVLVFSIGAFLVIGLRGGQWEPRLFLAVPLITLMFSYLFCVCVLIGVLTRSALAALLLTCLFWLFLFAINSTDGILTYVHYASIQRVENQKALIDRQERIRTAASTTRATTQAVSNIEQLRERIPEFEQEADRWRFWYRVQLSARTALPKTSETVGLLSRWIVDTRAFQQAEDQRDDRRFMNLFGRPRDRILTSPDGNARWPDDDQPELREKIREAREARSFAWITGTSFAFQFVVLGIAAWIFCRRDF